jgi:hypothetical protein
MPLMGCLQKNVFDSTIGLLGLSGKVKDGLKSREDLVDLKIRHELHSQELPNGKQYLPPASYNLTPDERLAMCKWLCGLKVPTRFSSKGDQRGDPQAADGRIHQGGISSRMAS